MFSIIESSRMNLFGRIMFIFSVLFCFMLFNSFIDPIIYQSNAQVYGKLFLTALIVFGLGLFGFGIFVVIGLIFAAIGWLISGYFDGSITDIPINIFGSFVYFIVLFIFGDWDRLFFLKKK